MNKKILITGATGFIGNFLVDEALKRNYSVYVAVRKSSNTEYFRKKTVHIVELDFSDVESLYTKIFLLPQFDYVIHNAGLTKSLNPNDYYEVNYRNTKRLINALKQQRKTPSKFLFMSSLAAFGPGEKKSANPVLLTSAPKPVTHYGKSKLAGEKFIVEKSDIPYIIFRPTAVYGPGEKDIFKAIKFMHRHIDFQIGKNKQHLTFIYVKDLARAAFEALETPYVNKAYFIGDGNIYSNLDMGKILSQQLKKKVFTISIPVWLATVIAWCSEISGKLSGKATILNVDKIKELSASNWNCDTSSMRNDFNFKAEYNLEKGLTETLNWYKQNGWLN